MRKSLIIISVLILSYAGLCQAPKDTAIDYNVEIFRSYLEKLNTDFVRKLDFTKLVHTGIDAMNKSLDPFTVFSDEAEVLKRNAAWQGYLFSGIGAQVGMRDSFVTVLGLYKNSPAQNAGLRIDDRIIEVEHVPVTGKSLSEVVTKLRGDEGSTVEIKVDRPGIGGVDISVIREKIIALSVNYYGMMNDSVGYIRCSQFLENSYDSMKVALTALEKNKKFSYLVLDLRDNTGGLAQDAVNTANLFLPKGKLICQLKTEKDTAIYYKYYALYEPVDTNVRIVAMCSAFTASAAEIILGALQDYDRAVIIGQTTYGKGLVQGTRELVHNTELYLTAAKYYTPSGRCIQAVDYSHQYMDGATSRTNDTTSYYTSHYRKINASSGIEPDIVTSVQSPLGCAAKLLYDNNVIGDFATMYRNTHVSNPDIGQFRLSKDVMDGFMVTARKEIKKYYSEDETKLKGIEQQVNSSSFLKKIKRKMHWMYKKLGKIKLRQLERERDAIKALLEKEIIIRYYNYDGQIEYSFLHDDEIKKALNIFVNGYDAILK